MFEMTSFRPRCVEMGWGGDNLERKEAMISDTDPRIVIDHPRNTGEGGS
jgi:hypothetical protein